MATTLRFKDHEDFQRAAFHMAVAGAVGGLGAFALATALPASGSGWTTATLIGAVAFGATSPAARFRLADLAVLGAVVAAIGLAVTTPVAAAVPAIGFGILVARGGRRFVATLAAAAVTLLLCRFVYGNLLSAAAVAGLPAWLAAGASGAAFGFVGVLGRLPRHVDIASNRVAAAHAASRTVLVGEVRELADRAVALWNRVDATLEPDAPVRAAIEDSVLRLFEVGQRWAAIEADGARAPPTSWRRAWRR